MQLDRRLQRVLERVEAAVLHRAAQELEPSVELLDRGARGHDDLYRADFGFAHALRQACDGRVVAEPVVSRREVRTHTLVVPFLRPGDRRGLRQREYALRFVHTALARVQQRKIGQRLSLAPVRDGERDALGLRAQIQLDRGLHDRLLRAAAVARVGHLGHRAHGVEGKLDERFAGRRGRGNSGHDGLRERKRGKGEERQQRERGGEELHKVGVKQSRSAPTLRRMRERSSRQEFRSPSITAGA